MQIDQLALVYTRKTDEELLKIAADPAQLTPEAITALSGELAKRRIKPEPRRDEDAARIEQPVVPTIAQPIRALPTNQFLADVLDLYRGNFWFFIKLTAPAVSISWAAIVLSRHLTHQMALRYVTGHTLIAHPIVVLKMGLVTWSAFFIDWTTFAHSVRGDLRGYPSNRNAQSRVSVWRFIASRWTLSSISSIIGFTLFAICLAARGRLSFVVSCVYRTGASARTSFDFPNLLVLNVRHFCASAFTPRTGDPLHTPGQLQNPTSNC